MQMRQGGHCYLLNRCGANKNRRTPQGFVSHSAYLSHVSVVFLVLNGHMVWNYTVEPRWFLSEKNVVTNACSFLELHPSDRSMFVFSSLLLVPNSDLYSCSWCVFFFVQYSLFKVKIGKVQSNIEEKISIPRI
jgi:hypothetical protein